jgi:hypothetical protein
VAYGDLAATKQLIDKISSYSNLLVVGCTGVTYDATKLNDICQYIYDRNMSFIVYTSDPRQPPQEWFVAAKNNWGSSFLGLYVDDEIGGKQLDKNFSTVVNATDYSDAAKQYENQLGTYLNFYSTKFNSATMFTSDYALYWFDYKAGYDTVFAEFGWNYSRQLNVALCRGAATTQNKDWGIIMTYTYTTPPYLESGENLYADMVLAYKNNAKYILIFDTNENYTQDILKEEHFKALKDFWQYIQENPRDNTPTSDRIAYVLPESYAYGFRGPNDKIWGLWEADSYSYFLSVSTDIMLNQYGNNLDIIYEDALTSGNVYGYSKILYWNDPAPVQLNWPPDMPDFPFPTTFPSPTPSPTPTAMPTAMPTSDPPTEQPTNSPTPSPTGELERKFFLPDSYVYAAGVGVVAIVAVTATLAVSKKRRHA